MSNVALDTNSGNQQVEISKTNKHSRLKLFRNNLPLLAMCMPAILLLIVFNYIPMAGLVMAFKKFNVVDGIFGSPWAGIDNFKFFFESMYAWRITRNTLGLNFIFIVTLLFGAITVALIINEISKRSLVKLFQTTMFFPHFLSWVVVSFALYSFLNMDLGILNKALGAFGIESPDWYANYKYWPFILTFMNAWKHVGYYSLIFYAGIIGISEEYYEAAKIDGATKMQMVNKITIPLIVPLIVVIALVQIGKIFYADFGMFFQLTRDVGVLLPATDVIDYYVFRTLRQTGDINLSAAAGFYQSIVGLFLVLLTNFIVKKVNPENALF